MLDSLIAGAATGGWGAIFGGVTGILGSGIQKWFAYKEAKLEAEERQKDRDHDLNVMQFEAKTAADMMTLEQAGKTERAEIGMLKASMANDTPLLKLEAISELSTFQRWLIVIVDVFCRFVRPSSTVYFQLLTTALGIWAAFMLYKAGMGLEDGISPMNIMLQIVDMVLYLTCTSTTWWFGVRGMSKK